MRCIWRLVSSLMLVLILAPGLQAQTAPDAAELTSLLKDFLSGASRSDPAIHDRFWAPDLIYTGSSGRRIGKADIMRDLRSPTVRNPTEAMTKYAAEDIRIQQYGDTAIVAFRLVSTTERGGKAEIANYLNSGTFLTREGKWQVVNWQATKVPRAEEASRKEVADAEMAFHQAMRSADVKTLATLADQSFIWTQRTGVQMTRQQLLDQLGSGQLKYAKLETNNVTVSVYGDTAVVRGESARQRSAFVGPGGSAGDAAPFTAFYTLTFINPGSGWKAVAMHTSRP